MYLILYQSYHPSILLGPMHQKAFIQICFKSIQSSNNNLLIRTKSCRIIRKFIRRITRLHSFVVLDFLLLRTTGVSSLPINTYRVTSKQPNERQQQCKSNASYFLAGAEQPSKPWFPLRILT